MCYVNFAIIILSIKIKSIYTLLSLEVKQKMKKEVNIRPEVIPEMK